MQGFGWAIAKALAEAGAEISLGVWVRLFKTRILSTWFVASDHDDNTCYLLQVPALSIFESSLRRGKFDANRKLANGGMLEFANIYPMDAVYDTPEDVPEDVCTQSFSLHLHACHNVPDLHHKLQVADATVMHADLLNLGCF